MNGTVNVCTGAEPISSAYSSSGQNLYVAAPVRGGIGNIGDGRRGPMSLEHDQPPRPPPPRNDGSILLFLSEGTYEVSY